MNTGNLKITGISRGVADNTPVSLYTLLLIKGVACNALTVLLKYFSPFYIIYGSLPKPDIYVYLHLKKDRLLENIRKRGRDYEKSITSEYLQKIQDSYFSFFRQNPENRYLILDINNVDFVTNENHYNLIMKTIFADTYTNGLNMVIL